MRHNGSIRSRATARRLLAAVPAAIVGSIALSLGATPANAVERLEDARHLDGAMPGKATGLRHGATSVATTAGAPSVARAIRPATATAPSTYVVQAGDTISAIAARFGLRTVDVLTWNGLGWSSIIYPDQSLTLAPAAVVAPVLAPAPTPAPSPAATHTVVAGDTISAIARHYGSTTDAVLGANGLTRASIIYPGQSIAIPGAAASAAPVPAPTPAPAPGPAPSPAATHTVVAGDTISAIARHYGSTTDAVLGANGLTRASIIYPGQSIAIPGAAAPASVPAPAPAPASANLDAEQAANAQLIIGIGRELGVSDRGIAIALATAMVESWMRNLDWGDRDSLGLFQQRPSTGWGTEAEVSDAARATRVFYGGPADPNGSRTRGLLDIPGWESMGFAQAAQSVQISAFPERYGAWEAAAYQWLAALG